MGRRGESKVQGENPTFASRWKIKSKIREGLILALLVPGFVLFSKFFTSLSLSFCICKMG